MTGAPRWVEVTPSPFPHEAEGLGIARDMLPQTSPYRAWSNVEFRDGQGKWHEVDLIVLGQRRLHLVELKYYSGTLRGDDLRWLRDGHRAEDSPLKLARRKAQRLASKLREELIRWAEETGTPIADTRGVVPFVQESVFLHHQRLRCILPQASMQDLFGLDGNEGATGLPGLSQRLLEPPTEHESISEVREEILLALMSRIGLVQRRQREVGSWMIDDETLGEGDGWQDWPAAHRIDASERVRIRVQVTPPGAAPADVARVRKVVNHEYKIMSRLAHDGILRPRDLVDDELGVGLVYPYDNSFERLDLWQANRPQGLPLTEQLSLLRQVAEAVGYAHRHGVVHRGLSPLAVSVKELAGQGVRVLVGDWQSAGAATGAPLTGMAVTGVTALVGTQSSDRLGAILQPEGADLLRRQAEAFQAPEGVWHAAADRVRLDVFALGALAYYILAGQTPASDRVQLVARLNRDKGLDLAADLPQVSTALRTLVLSATRPAVSYRLADVGAFLTLLDAAEQATVVGEDVADPLEAVPGQVVGDRWQIQRRLGVGSTAVGLLVNDLRIGTGNDARRVLKVAINDAAAGRLDAEAEVLTVLTHPRVVRLIEGPLLVGNRRALVLESAGEQTLGDALSGRTRLSLDLLERWGTDLLEVLVALDRAGIDHRDIKPANLGVREGRSDRSKHLVLFDFSLSRAGATALTAGTPPYLDPFLESVGRGRYDSAAERYAAAVVLFEMATGRTPVYGDGLSDPAAVLDEATVEPGQFDPALAPGLVLFFRTALARDATRRHDTATDLFAAWTALFTPALKTTPDDAEARSESAQPTTPLVDAGLSARALSALEPFGVTTVADLVAIDPFRLTRLSGVAEPTRKEVKERAKRWRDRFAAAVTGRGRPAAEQVSPGSAFSAAATAALLMTTVGATRATSRRRAAGLLLGVEPGLGDPFATQGDLAAALALTRPRAAQLLASLQDAWATIQTSRDQLDELTALATIELNALGGVATVEELSSAVLAALPPDSSGDLPSPRLAAGLLRVALDRGEALQRAGEGGVVLIKRRRAGQVIAIATDPALLDAAEALGRRADDLVDRALGVDEPVLGASRAAAGLRGTLTRTAETAVLSDERLVQLAAALSQHAALSGRGELHHRDLDLATALRLALAGVGGTQTLVTQEIRDRVRARFPSLPALPDRPRLDALIAEAALPLVHDDAVRAFRAPTLPGSTGIESRLATRMAVPGAPLSLSGGQIDHRLAESVRSRSFLALGVQGFRLDRAAGRLAAGYDAVVLDVTSLLLDALRAQSDGKISWAEVVAADAAQPGSREQLGLSHLVGLALPMVAEAIESACLAAPRGSRPVLLTEVAPLARYDRLATLSRWTDLAAPREQAIWLLVPQLVGSDGPVVDGRPLPLGAPGQFLRLDQEWVDAATPAHT